MSFRDYWNRIRDRDNLAPDPGQDRLADLLDDLAGQLIGGQGKSWFSRAKSVKGVYLYGPVGRGKSFMVNHFLDYLDDTGIANIYRRHRHDFLAELHNELNRANGHRRQAIKQWGKQLGNNYDLITLDEMEVTDVADAMLLPPLFNAIGPNNPTPVIMTSNIAPDDLYAGGLQRDRFLPFIQWIHDHMRVVNLDHGTDYRLSKLPAKDRYFYPLNNQTKSDFDRAATRLIPDGYPPLILDLNGRQMTIDRHHNASGVTDFNNLCDNPYGTADYDRLADRLRLLFLDEVPILSRHEKNRTRRLIHLVDVFYDRGRRIIPRADALPADLLTGGPLMGEFKRTASRLESWRRMDDYGGTKTGLSQ